LYKNIFKTTRTYLGKHTSFLINNGCVFVRMQTTNATALSYYDTQIYSAAVPSKKKKLILIQLVHVK